MAELVHQRTHEPRRIRVQKPDEVLAALGADDLLVDALVELLNLVVEFLAVGDDEDPPRRIVVSETADGQRITCHLANNTEAIPKGTYKVRLASHGLDPTAPLSVVTKTVTLVEAIPEPGPETLAFTSATSEGCETGTVKLGKRMTVVGTAMRAPADGEFFQLLCPNGEGSRSAATLESVTVAADGHSLSCTPGEVQGDAPVSGTGEVSLRGNDGELLASCEVSFVAG